MSEITCPHCESKFNIDDVSYSNILKQVHNQEFEIQVNERLKRAEIEHNSALNLYKKDAELKLEKTINDKNTEIQIVKSDNMVKLRKAEDNVKEFRSQKEISEIKLKSEYEQKINSDAEYYKNQIKDREETIDRMKEMKAKLSTKMVGETLEQHCEIEFNRLRATGFQNAYFEKDNDASSGSKGDYIFKDKDDSNNEIVSIMFEMKNENDTTATKTKNEHFLKELDKDRNEKGCEYAVLVSLLEQDSELYNGGIVDVSHKYPKMYVVRPQFFIPIITLLRNGALNSLKYKNELAQIREQNLDITNFQADLDNFKENFGRNYNLASRQFFSAIEQIDKTISSMQKIKDELLRSNNNLRLANDKADNLTITKLTRNNPTMAAMFEDNTENDE